MSTENYIQVVVDLNVYAHIAELYPKSPVASSKISKLFTAKTSKRQT